MDTKKYILLKLSNGKYKVFHSHHIVKVTENVVHVKCCSTGSVCYTTLVATCDKLDDLEAIRKNLNLNLPILHLRKCFLEDNNNTLDVFNTSSDFFSSDVTLGSSFNMADSISSGSLQYSILEEKLNILPTSTPEELKRKRCGSPLSSSEGMKKKRE